MNPKILDNKNDKFLAAYNIANDQTKLYAEFRWKAFYYIAALNGGMFILFLQPEKKSFQIIIICISILFTLLILRFEKRHKELFEQSREVGRRIEKELFGEDLSNYYGVFNSQIGGKGKITHGKLLIITSVLIIVFWFFILAIVLLR